MKYGTSVLQYLIHDHLQRIFLIFCWSRLYIMLSWQKSHFIFLLSSVKIEEYQTVALHDSKNHPNGNCSVSVKSNTGTVFSWIFPKCLHMENPTVLHKFWGIFSTHQSCSTCQQIYRRLFTHRFLWKWQITLFLNVTLFT